MSKIAETWLKLPEKRMKRRGGQGQGQGHRLLLNSNRIVKKYAGLSKKPAELIKI